MSRELFIEKTKELLTHQIKVGRVFSAYLILGDGATEVATFFTKLANCLDIECNGTSKCMSCKKIDSGNHLDIRWTATEGLESIGINEVRQVIMKACYRPAEAMQRFFVIPEAWKLTEEAQNALLKILEEPPQFTSIILLGRADGQFLTTVLSRCNVIRIGEAGLDKVTEKTYAAEFNVLEIIKKIIIKKEVNLPDIFTEIDRERAKTKGMEELGFIVKWLVSGFYGRDTGVWALPTSTIEEAKWWRGVSTERLNKMLDVVYNSMRKMGKKGSNENLIWRSLIVELRDVR